MKCLDPSIQNCQSITGPLSDFKIELYPTKQCLKICDNSRIESLNGDYCYESLEESCKHSDDANSIAVSNKCRCLSKFYKMGTKIICLPENAVCPQEYSLYITSTKECVPTCPTEGYKYTFKNFCLDSCPQGSSIGAGNICTCAVGGQDKFWYETSPGNYHCLDGACPDEYHVYDKDTKQCLKTCTGTYYPYLYNNKCYKLCSDIPDIINGVEIEINSEYGKLSCGCKNPWYYDTNNLNKKTCPVLNTINDCSQYSTSGTIFNFMISDTLQCLNECPTEYPYQFNRLCFKSCEDFGYNIKAVESSYECQCMNLWYEESDEYGKTIKQCLDEIYTECIEFNDEYQYEIYKTKKCVKTKAECPNHSFTFNFKCYERCPNNTLENTESDHTDECICDKTKGYWYEYEKLGREYLVCGVEECPKSTIENVQDGRPNLLEKDDNKYHKCVLSCSEDDAYKYAFRNLCVKKCPEGTKVVGDTCEFYDLINDEEINNLQAMKNAANIKAKELYLDSNLKSGYLLNKFDASLQIYSINKDNTNRNLSIKSNLTYIDLGTCVNKIFEDGNLPNNDEILVAKYDLLYRYTPPNTDPGDNTPQDGNSNSGSSQSSSSSGTNNNGYSNNNLDNNDDSIKSLINPVEYEFYLMSNMSKIDGSICDPYEILVSYPISFNKNKFNNYETGINNNKYLKQFEIGKKLHQQNPDIDTFNKDNIVYKDICLGIEIDGKDLVLEDRYNYLYPNNVTLCESNCTMDKTDFDLERINCKCTYKEIIDFKRVDKDSNDILSDPDFHKPTQSGANAEIIKCLAKLDIKKGIVNNEAFYYSTAITVIEVSMAILSAVKGISAVSSFIKGMPGVKVANPGMRAGTTNKILNNPPKKQGEDEDEDEKEKERNIVIRKNIKMDYNNNKEEISHIKENNSNINNDNEDINYGVNIKSGFAKSKQIEIQENKNKNNFNYNIDNNYYGMKAEFIPMEYNFKFFNQNDKGVIKKIKRSQIPFEINNDTKILLEGKKGIIYDDNYLEGPFYEEQNIIEIIDDMNDINNNTKIIKFYDNNNDNNISNMYDNKINKRNIKYNKNEEKARAKNKILNYNLNTEDKELITIKRINPINKAQLHKIEIEDYKEDEEIKKIDDITTIYNLMKREHTYLRASYEKYMSKRHPNILSIFLAEILDKIYFIKIFIFLKKFEILSIHISLYMFCHLLLLSILCGFFTVKTIKKIWEDSNYPNINFYLLYGFLANIIVWVIYRIFLLLLDNQDRIRALVNLNNNDKNREKNIDENEDDNFNNKFQELIKKIKIQTAVFYIIILLLTILCFIYLLSFFAIYTGTKGKVFTVYYISIIEIILIKFVYGLCLASLRIAGEGNGLKSLYNIVCFCDKYLA